MSVEIQVTPEQRETVADLTGRRVGWRTVCLVAGLNREQRLQVLQCVEAGEAVEFVAAGDGEDYGS